MIREYPDELEADLLEFFGVDLLDLWRGRLSLRRIGVLIKSLMAKPGRSTLLQALDGRTQWAESNYFLARISDSLELSNFLFIKANSNETDDLEFPVPIPRPGEPEPVQPEPYDMSTPQEVHAFFGQMNSL